MFPIMLEAQTQRMSTGMHRAAMQSPSLSYSNKLDKVNATCLWWCRAGRVPVQGMMGSMWRELSERVARMKGKSALKMQTHKPHGLVIDGIEQSQPKAQAKCVRDGLVKCLLRKSAFRHSTWKILFVGTYARMKHKRTSRPSVSPMTGHTWQDIHYKNSVTKMQNAFSFSWHVLMWTWQCAAPSVAHGWPAFHPNTLQGAELCATSIIKTTCHYRRVYMIAKIVQTNITSRTTPLCTNKWWNIPADSMSQPLETAATQADSKSGYWVCTRQVLSGRTIQWCEPNESLTMSYEWNKIKITMSISTTTSLWVLLQYVLLVVHSRCTV